MAAKPIVYLVTKNPTKILVAQEKIGSGIKVKILAKETPEIQSLDSAKVASFSAKWAADKFNRPVLKMDTALSIDALGGFPGTFSAYFDKAIGPRGIIKLMEGKTNRRARITTSLAYCFPGKSPVVETDFLKGLIAKKLSGKKGWFLDKFFIPAGFEKTLGSYPDSVRKGIWPSGCWKRIGKRILLTGKPK